MLKVFKYAIPIDDHFAVQMPKGAILLSLQVQRGQPCIWALVDPTQRAVSIDFRLAGTGHSIEDDPGKLKHVGSFQMEGGALVFHLFRLA